MARCFATQWLRFAFKRDETEADRASLEAVIAAFAKGNSITDLLVGAGGLAILPLPNAQRGGEAAMKSCPSTRTGSRDARC